MKRVIISLLAVLALFSCQKEVEFQPLDSKTFTATIEDNCFVETRTSLDGQNVLWKKENQVSIFKGTTLNQQYKVTDASDGKKEAALQAVSSPEFVSADDIDNNVAFYPYSSDIEIEENKGSYVLSGITLPSTQNYAAGSFGDGAFPMVAVTGSTSDMNLKFKNVLGCLKLQLKGTAKVASITITGNNNEVLCGSATVAASNGSVPSINMGGSSKTVTLDCGSGVQLSSGTATSFVIALPPMTMSGGFTVLVTDAEGKKMEIKTTKSQTIERSAILKMPAVVYEGSEPDYSQEPFTITSVGSTSVSIAKEDTPYDITLEYRKGTGSWSAYTIGNEISLADGEHVQFRAGEGGNEYFSKKDFKYYNIVVNGNGNVKASGNIMSLLDRTLARSTMPDYGFTYLFLGCAKLLDASNLKLPATTLASGCYESMFSGCTSLTEAPELHATNLAKSCYNSMFIGCTSLTSAPKLPATTLAESCYKGMFYYCTSLTAASELPATNLTNYCYQEMFTGCTKMNYVKALFTTTPSNAYTKDWLSGVSATGTFVKSKDATWDVTGPNGIPEGWTVKEGKNDNGHKYVNMGLPSGMLWADMLMGYSDTILSSPPLYSWGYTSGSKYDSNGYYIYNNHYKYLRGDTSLSDFAKVSLVEYYDNSVKYYHLGLDNDIAHYSLGGDWRMPTKQEFQELLENTTYSEGYLVSKNNDNKIYIGGRGGIMMDGRREFDSNCYIWTSTILASNAAPYSYDRNGHRITQNYSSWEWGLAILPVLAL